MAFKLSELLNPAPSSNPSSPQLHQTSHELSQDSSPAQADRSAGAQLSHDKHQQITPLDVSPPRSSEVKGAASIELSTSVERDASSPSSDYHHLSPSRNQTRHPSVTEMPKLAPPTLTPIHPQYDVIPPGTRLQMTNGSHAVGEQSSADIEPAIRRTSSSDVQFGEASIQSANVELLNQAEVVNRPRSHHNAEHEAVPLGLAVLDGAQEETRTPEEKILPVETTASKSAGRPHRGQNGKPSEGSSDKRFLCYICVKLFTRRRSVRDHIKKIHNDTHFDVARAIEVTVDPETGESVVPLSELVKTIPTPSGDPQSANIASQSPSRGSSADTNTFPTPAPVAGKKRSAPDESAAHTTALKRKGTAKPKALNSGKKAKLVIDDSTSSIVALRSPSGTPVSSRGSKPPALAKVKSHVGQSLANSPAPTDRMSLVPTNTDSEVEDPPDKVYISADEVAEVEGSDGNETFCICRKGDNHTWMIGCDGGCEDWFHGKCVNIQERDGDLIDKYICPTCEEKGQGQTTWKRMCRRTECRKPARVLAEPPSKYCSDECNRRFWVSMVKRSDPNALVSEDGLMVIGSKAQQKVHGKRKQIRGKLSKGSASKDVKKHEDELDHDDKGSMNLLRSQKDSVSSAASKAYKADIFVGEVMPSDDDEQLPLPTRGGVLSVSDIKMVLNQAGTVDSIRQLGEKPPTPPYTSDFDTVADDVEGKMGIKSEESLPPEEHEDDSNQRQPFAYTVDERLKLDTLCAEKRRLADRIQILRDQEKLLGMIKARSAAIIEAMQVTKAKNVCGFDARLSWSGAEFEQWRASRPGRSALEAEEIGDPQRSIGDAIIKKEKPGEEQEDTVIVNGVPDHEHDRYENQGRISNNDNDNDDEDDDGDGDGDDDQEDSSSRRQTAVAAGDAKRKGGKSKHKSICIRNKCPRHREWRRLLASEYKFEQEGIRKQMRSVDSEARSVRESAALRVLCE